MTRLFILMICLPIFVFANNNDNGTKTTSTLNAAIVYRNGATLQHTAIAALKTQDAQLTIEGLSSYVDLNSLQVTCPEAVTILGIEFNNNYLNNENLGPAAERLKDTLESTNKAIKKIDAQIENFNNLLDILNNNKQVKGEQAGLSVAELAKLMTYYESKALEIKNKLNDAFEVKTKLQVQQQKLQNQFDEERKKNTVSGGRLVLQLNVQSAGSYEFGISYLTSNASWVPYYDIKATSINSPLKFVYKAKIAQSTGIDWKKVKLSLSTSTPTQFGNAPVQKTWLLSYVNIIRQMNNNLYKMNTIPAAVASAEVAYDKERSDNAYSGLDEYVTVTDNELDITYDIAIPYDVPTNGKQQIATLKESEIAASYKYYAVPKLSKETYLLAEVANWQTLNLLPGEANVIFEGTYIGKTIIDPASTNDTLNLTLGSDKRVIVKREKVTDYSSTKLIGTNKLQTLTYDISVKNNKKEPINLIIKDQFPISTNKDIEVSRLESNGATVNDENGFVTWQENIEPGKGKKLRFSYSVKYPKNKTLNLQ